MEASAPTKHGPEQGREDELETTIIPPGMIKRENARMYWN